jgi:hypothetical protein
MAQTFGIATGALQVADFDAQLSEGLWRCANDIYNAYRELESTAKEVEVTATVLSSAGGLLQNPDTKGLHTRQLLQDTQSVQHGC